MSRQENVTKDAAFTALDALTAENIKPTLAALREKVGGSFTTLSPWLNAWKEQQQSQTQPIPDMPDALQATLKRATASLWETANEIAGERIEEAQRNADERIATAESELKDYQTEVARLEAQLAQAETDNANLKTLHNTLEKSLTVEQSAKSKAEGEAASLHGLLERQEQRADELQAQLIALVKKVTPKDSNKSS